MDTTMLKGGSIQALMQLVRRMFLEIHTCIPGEIIAFDSEKQLATVRSCIRNTMIDENGETTWIDSPQIIDVPVVFLQSQTRGFAITCPVEPGDQCLLFFSERSYDNWLEYGSVQNPAENGVPRSHQYNDAFALVGISPLVSSIQDFQTDGVEIRNKDRSIRFSLTDTAITLRNNKVVLVLNKDNFITKLEDENGNDVASIVIDKDGNINITSLKNVNISGDTVNVTANTATCTAHEVDVTGATGNIVFTDVLNITCPNIIITGDVLLDGELFAKTYMVGSNPDQTVGVIASYNDERIERNGVNDKPQSS